MGLHRGRKGVEVVAALEDRDDAAAGAWVFLTSGVAGADGMVTVTDAGAASLPRRFYRVAAFT